MPSAPASPHASTFRLATRLAVRLGDAQGNPPTAADEVGFLKPIRLRRSAGGAELDTLTFRYDLGATGERIENLRTPTGFARQVEVWLIDDDGTPAVPLAWGELTRQDLTLTDRDEAVEVTATLQPYHFGSPLRGMSQWEPVHAEANVRVLRDVVFNPLIDGEVRGNLFLTGGGVPFDSPTWVDPESIRSGEAETLLGGTAAKWELAQAVRATGEACNADETFVVNPTAEELEAPLKDAPGVVNLRLRRGLFLPAYLDALLHPYGFDWQVRVEVDVEEVPEEEAEEEGETTETVVRRIRVFRRNPALDDDDPETDTPEHAVVPKPLYWLPVGTALADDPAGQNVSRFLAATDVADLANVLVGDGALLERQVTVELFRAWPESDDALTAEELDRTDPDSQYAAKPYVWRRFVGNEAGDYGGLRTDVRPIPTAPAKLWNFLSARLIQDRPFVTRRRSFEPLLVLGEDGRRLPPRVDYSLDDGDTWAEVPSGWGTVELDEAELAITFAGDRPPAELIEAGENARIRVTGTIVGDDRLSDTVQRRSASPNLRDVTLHLDLADRFGDSEIETGTWSGHDEDGDQNSFGSVVEAGAAGTVERDDAEALTEYLESLQKASDSAAQVVEVTLAGLITSYEIGDVIDRLAGRDVSLDLNSEAASERRYVQVRAVTWYPEQQRTVLDLTPVDAAS